MRSRMPSPLVCGPCFVNSGKTKERTKTTIQCLKHRKGAAMSHVRTSIIMKTYRALPTCKLTPDIQPKEAWVVRVPGNRLDKSLTHSIENVCRQSTSTTPEFRGCWDFLSELRAAAVSIYSSFDISVTTFGIVPCGWCVRVCGWTLYLGSSYGW